MTSEKSELRDIRKILLSREAFHPFPKYDEREPWESLPQKAKDIFLSREEEILNFESSALSAIKYMGYYCTNYAGDYHTHISARRDALLTAVMCECIQHEGKFLDKIIDLVWATCEESSWIDPDHNNHMHDHMLSGKIKNALPDVLDYNFVDLVAGTTSSLLAWTYYLLKEPLDELTPMVCERIEIEIMKRVVIPFMHHDDMTWNGFYGHKINNWNPWIVSNILCADLICVKDPDLRAKFFSRAMEKLDIYINYMHPDGGCDEGPGYWGAAGATLYDCLAILSAATDGKLNFFSEPLIRNIGEYIAKANIQGDRYTNFADNGPHTQTDSLMLYRFSEHIDSDFLRSFALTHADPEALSFNASHMARSLWNLFLFGKLPPADKPFVPGCHWLPDTETLFARDEKNEMQFSAKGGFNNESHNHNDLGHFILYWKGAPIFADLGCLPYTARTFSPFRYEIWILQSAWHSCGRINGFDQHGGDEYKAEILNYADEDGKLTLSMELRGAYEAEANIESYVRTFIFDRKASRLSLRDHVELTEASSDVEAHFITVTPPELTEGKVLVPVGDAKCALSYDPATVTASVDSHDLEKAKKSWDTEKTYRIHLISDTFGKSHDICAEFCMA